MNISRFRCPSARMCVFASTLLLPLSLFAEGGKPEIRTFTSVEGIKIEASVVKVEGDNVVIQKAGDTRTATVPISKFSKADREWLGAWATEAAENYVPRLDVKVSRKMKDNFTGQTSGDIRVRLSMKVFAKNDEAKFDVVGAKARLVTFGVDVTNKNRLKVLNLEEFDVDIPAGKTLEFSGTEISNEYDDNHPSVWGEKYYANMIVIKNSKGSTIFVNSSAPSVEEYEEAFMKLSKGQFCDRKLKPEGGAGMNKNKETVIQ